MGGTPPEPPVDTVDTVDRPVHRLAVLRSLDSRLSVCDLPGGVGCLTYRRCPYARDKRADRRGPERRKGDREGHQRTGRRGLVGLLLVSDRVGEFRDQYI